jgi:hypothetical protein
LDGTKIAHMTESSEDLTKPQNKAKPEKGVEKD